MKQNSGLRIKPEVEASSVSFQFDKGDSPWYLVL